VDIFYTGIGRSVSFSLNIQSKEERPVKEKFCTTGMSGSRKSDNNIVPEKPANNEVKTFAEQVEGTALTEGNTMNTAAVRTQGRGAASTGLGGVRKKFSVITRGRGRMR
jgi:hypothetical protein